LNKFLLQSRVVSRAGFRYKFVKMFRPISGLHTKLFHNIQSNDFFSFVTYICCAYRGWSDYDFASAQLFANTAAFFCSLLGLVSHSF